MIHLYAWDDDKSTQWLCPVAEDARRCGGDYFHVGNYVNHIHLQNVNDLCENCKQHPLFNLVLLTTVK